MGRRTTLWLLLVGALLAAVIVWQRGREETEDLGSTDIALFEGLAPERVQAFVIDHLERSLQLRLERDARGIWYITDPILYAADPGVVTLLLDTVGETRALIVPEVERDAKQLGFDPPRAVFIVEEDRDGERVRHTIELGHLDLDGKLLNVRRDGRYLRILRKLDSTLKRSVDDFRSPRVLQLAGNSIVALNRWGSIQESIDEEPRDLRLNAVRDGDVWRALVPYEAALDPLDFSVLLYGAGGLRADRFIDDEAVDLAQYGLAEPLFRVELLMADGSREGLLFGRTGPHAWFAKRELLPNVYGVSAEDMQRVLIPFEELVERRVLRVAREEIDAIRLESPEREVRVARAAEGWVVSERATEAGAFGPDFPAELARVEELHAALEQFELVELRLDASFPDDAPRRGVYVEANGVLHGGSVGPEVADAAGAPACWFRREGDEICSLAPLGLLALTDARADLYRSLDIALTSEVFVTALELERDDERLRFERDERGRWCALGSTDEARELLTAMDALLFLRASAHAGELAPADLTDPIAVKFELRDGAEPVRFRVGLAPAEGAASFVERMGAVARLKSEGLHAQLAGLFGG